MKKFQTRACATREADERLLAMLAMRDSGVTCAEISHRLGAPKNTVKSRTNAVYRDLAQSEEA